MEQQDREQPPTTRRARSAPGEFKADAGQRHIARLFRDGPSHNKFTEIYARNVVNLGVQPMSCTRGMLAFFDDWARQVNGTRVWGAPSASSICDVLLSDAQLMGTHVKTVIQQMLDTRCFPVQWQSTN